MTDTGSPSPKQQIPNDPSDLKAPEKHAVANRLTGKVAIITGSASGIGQAIAIRLAAEGAAVVIDYVGAPSAAEETRGFIESQGGKAIAVQADISKPDQARTLVEQTYAQLGRCDILVNNAGVERGSAFQDVSEADYDFVLDVNLKGTFFTTQAFVKRLLDGKSPGRVVNISSVHEDMVFPHFSTYAASKGAERMLMRNLAVELGPSGITVNNVAPGAIVTPINKNLLNNQQELQALLKNIPLGRMGTSAEVAGLVAYLVSEEAAYITGSTFIIDGGLIRNYHEQ
jgi:glucose 1-dehydrogenase